MSKIKNGGLDQCRKV